MNTSGKVAINNPMQAKTLDTSLISYRMVNILEMPTFLENSKLISGGINAVGNTHFPKNMKVIIFRAMIPKIVPIIMNDKPIQMQLLE